RSFCPLVPSFSVLLHTTPTAFYTLSLHDALPISFNQVTRHRFAPLRLFGRPDYADDTIGCRPINQSIGSGDICIIGTSEEAEGRDRKSTRLNSSHGNISYAVFVLKKKKKLSIAQH